MLPAVSRRLLTLLVLSCPTGVLSCLTGTLSLAGEGHRILAADSSKQRIAIVAPDGTLEWEYRIGPLHDIQRLDNGHILFQTSWTKLVEWSPEKQAIVWEYDAATSNGNQGRKVEVHAFQRLADGSTMISESGPARIIEVNPGGKLLRQIKLKVAQPHAHHDTRLVRKLDNGHYLVCHEQDGIVREYDDDGAVAWEYEIPLFEKPRKPGHGADAFGNQVFSAIRLANGNTLIGTGNGHSVLEVTPDHEIVWSLHQNDVPGVQLAWVTTLQVLENGNIVIGNCHAGPDNPQVIEVTRDKQLVWKFHDFEYFGNALTNTIVVE